MKRRDMKSTQELIKEECDFVRDFLLQKNEEYGDSAINPVRIFSSSDPIEQINVRIDDKLSRIKNKKAKFIKEDTILDLLGYLHLRRICENSISDRIPEDF